MEREDARSLPEESGTVGGDDGDVERGGTRAGVGDPSVGDADRSAAVAGQGELGGGGLGRARGAPARQDGGDPAGQVGDETGLPRTPGGRAGGEAVRYRESGEGLQDDGVADPLGDR